MTTIKRTFYLAKLVKEKDPSIVIGVGGPQVTLDPESFVRKDIDYLFLGEADLTLLQLVMALVEDQETRFLPTGVLRNRNGVLEDNTAPWRRGLAFF